MSEIGDTNRNADEGTKPLSTNAQLSTEKVQWFLVRFAVALAVLGFVAFLITRDIRLLLSSSLLAYPLIVVINYYFPNERR